MNESPLSVKQLITLSFKCSTCVAASLLCSVVFLVVNELLCLLREPPPLSLLLLQGLICFLTLVDLHPGECQTQQQCLQGEDVQEDGDVVQSLRIERVNV